MKTLFAAYRVTDLDHALAFYTALGYIEVGRVAGSDGGRLALLRFPDEPVATLELVHRPGDGAVDLGSGFDHLAIQVDTLATTLRTLTKAGLELEPIQHPAGPRGPKVSWLTDPDGYRIEFVEWPPGHPTASQKPTSPEAVPDGRIDMTFPQRLIVPPALTIRSTSTASPAIDGSRGAPALTAPLATSCGERRRPWPGGVRR